jgi:stalled ribosome rescue protein Dom34
MPVARGIKEVRDAIGHGAVKTILIADNHLRVAQAML